MGCPASGFAEIIQSKDDTMMHKRTICISLLLILILLSGTVFAEDSSGAIGKVYSYSAIPLETGDCLIVKSVSPSLDSMETESLSVVKVDDNAAIIWETDFDVLGTTDTFEGGGILPDGSIWLRRAFKEADARGLSHSLVLLTAEGIKHKTIPLPVWTRNAWMINGSIYVSGERAFTEAERNAGLVLHVPIAAKLDMTGSVVFTWDSHTDFDYNGTPADAVSLSSLPPYDATVDNGLYLYGGYVYPENIYESFGLLARIDENGHTAYSYQPDDRGRIASICPLADGGVVGVGPLATGNQLDGPQYIFRLDHEGHVLIDTIFSIAPGTCITDIRPRKGGYAVLGGMDILSTNAPSFANDFIVLLDESGQFVACHALKPELRNAQFMPSYADASTLLVRNELEYDPLIWWRVVTLDSALGDVLSMDIP